MVNILSDQLRALNMRRSEEGREMEVKETRITKILYFTEELKRNEGILQKQRQELEKQESERTAREQDRKKGEMRLELDRYYF